MVQAGGFVLQHMCKDAFILNGENEKKKKILRRNVEMFFWTKPYEGLAALGRFTP